MAFFDARMFMYSLRRNAERGFFLVFSGLLIIPIRKDLIALKRKGGY